MTITPFSSVFFKRFSKLADTEALAIAHIGDCDAGLGLATALTQIFQISHPFQSSTYHNGHMALDTAKLTKCATMRGLASAQCLFGETILHGVGGLAAGRSTAAFYLRAAVVQGHDHAIALYRGPVPQEQAVPRRAPLKGHPPKTADKRKGGGRGGSGGGGGPSSSGSAPWFTTPPAGTGFSFGGGAGSPPPAPFSSFGAQASPFFRDGSPGFAFGTTGSGGDGGGDGGY